MKQDFRSLNAELNLYDENGKLQLHKDKEAVREYFLQHVNQNTVFFHSLEEKLDYLFENGYYDKAVFDQYPIKFLKALYKRAYNYKFRFPTFLGAYKFYESYALKTFDGERYLERFEDRVVAVAATLAQGDTSLALNLVKTIMSGIYQPATPTFLNAGRLQRGEYTSCFLIRVEDNMESITSILSDSLQLSKRGGGVGILLTNLREAGAPIKGMEGQASGVVPVMKMLEDAFSYANQLGQRSGAGAVYLHANHPDIMEFLDTKRENADEKIRIKTLSTGVIIPDVMFHLAQKGEDMYTFSPYDVERVTGKAMSDISITEYYDEFVENPEIRKKKINPRRLLSTIAELQFESGYPYIMFEDNVNRANPIEGHINMSNLCSEILQVNEASTFNIDGSYDEVGRDISCNLGSLNIAKVVNDFNAVELIVDTAIRSLSSVSEQTDVRVAPSVDNGNTLSRAIGLGQMNFHGYLASVGIEYGSPESIEFIHGYMSTITFYALKASMELAKETGEKFYNFENSDYATGKYFDKYIYNNYRPTTPEVKDLFGSAWDKLPNARNWEWLRDQVMKYGLYNQNLQAIPPTGSISYINNSTSSIHPIAAPIEIRKEGKLGRVYYPAPHLTQENFHLYEDAYAIGPEKLIDVYAAFQEHVDQSLSLTMFFKDGATTRDVNKAQIYAWRSGIKTLYYIRVRQMALEGTGLEECVSCQL